MVQATINISEKSNKILNLVKSKYGLKNKSQAIEKIIEKIINNKILEILENPYRYKPLKKPLQNKQRIHIDKSSYLLYTVRTLCNLFKGFIKMALLCP